MSSGWEELGPGQKLGLCSDCGLGWIKLRGARSVRCQDRARAWGARAGMSSGLRSDWEELGKGGTGARVGDWKS